MEEAQNMLYYIVSRQLKLVWCERTVYTEAWHRTFLEVKYQQHLCCELKYYSIIKSIVGKAVLKENLSF